MGCHNNEIKISGSMFQLVTAAVKVARQQERCFVPLLRPDSLHQQSLGRPKPSKGGAPELKLTFGRHTKLVQHADS